MVVALGLAYTIKTSQRPGIFSLITHGNQPSKAHPQMQHTNTAGIGPLPPQLQRWSSSHPRHDQPHKSCHRTPMKPTAAHPDPPAHRRPPAGPRRQRPAGISSAAMIAASAAQHALVLEPAPQPRRCPPQAQHEQLRTHHGQFHGLC